MEIIGKVNEWRTYRAISKILKRQVPVIANVIRTNEDKLIILDTAAIRRKMTGRDAKGGRHAR